LGNIEDDDMRCIDLFSGLGGFSQAFLDRGHEVTRYDIDRQFRDVPNTIIRDVLTLTSKDLTKADIVLAGIECTHLTYANQNLESMNHKKAVKLAKHTMNIIQEASPSYWVIENPKNSRLWTIIGKPNYITAWGYWSEAYFKPTGLKGILPHIEWPTKYTEPIPKESWNLEIYKTNKFSYLCDRNPARRSLIPYTFSEALCIAIEENRGTQETLT